MPMPLKVTEIPRPFTLMSRGMQPIQAIHSIAIMLREATIRWACLRMVGLERPRKTWLKNMS